MHARMVGVLHTPQVRGERLYRQTGQRREDPRHDL